MTLALPNSCVRGNGKILEEKDKRRIITGT